MSLHPVFALATAGLLLISIATRWPLAFTGWVSLVVVSALWFTYARRQ